MNRQYIVKSISSSFPTEWHNATQFGGQSGARKLQMLLLSKNARWVRESGLKSITLDADSTVKSVCGNQEGAEKGHNTTKKGAKSYHPLLIFVSEMKLLYHTWFRSGSAYIPAKYMTLISLMSDLSFDSFILEAV